MANEPPDDEQSGTEREGALHHVERKVAEHIRAAEVAMEEAAGYGEMTALIKGAEAAVDPRTELGSDEEEEHSPSR